MTNGETRCAELRSAAQNIRIDIVNMIADGGSGHPGGSLSAAEILATLYFDEMRLDPAHPELEDRDRFILSKGHAAPALYAVLSERGFFPKEWLSTFSGDGSKLQKHPDHVLVPGVEISTGSLGMGLSISLGIAMDARIRKKEWRVYCLLGDGECDEGTVWEAAMCASHFDLANVLAIVDRNHLQVDGSTSDIMNLAPMDQKWEAFGWHVVSIDGHDIEQILTAFEGARSVKDKPSVIIANTIKGKGVSFVEDRAEWHAGSFTEDQRRQAVGELSGAV